MASSSDNDNESSTDDLNDLVFHDAIDQLNHQDTSISSSEQPRWRLSSRNNSIQQPDQFWTVPLTDNQLHAVQIRDKLQKLRVQDRSVSKPDEDLPRLQIPMRDENKDSSISLSSERLSSPVHLAIRSSNSESNLVDLMTIDRITKYGEIDPNSPKLDDDEILRQPILFNRDTGKYMPLNDANPMIQTILERVHGNNNLLSNSLFLSTINPRKNSSDLAKSDSNLSRPKRYKNDDEEYSSSSDSSSAKSGSPSLSDHRKKVSGSTESKTKESRLKFSSMNFFRRKKKILPEQEKPIDEDENEKVLINDGQSGELKYKSSKYLHESPQFDKTQLLQTIDDAHLGPIWCMRFSPDGHLLATGGQDCLLKIWVLKSAQVYFDNFSRFTSNSQSEILKKNFQDFYQRSDSEISISSNNTRSPSDESQHLLFGKPFYELSGHQAPVLDVAWSKSLFLLSCSMDKTVRLWHLSRSECLCFFRHVDFVSTIAFHPRDDRYFLSGSLDGHVRLWNIPDKRVIYWSLVPVQASSLIPIAQTNLITAVNFCDEGRKVVVGTFDGRFLLYTDSLQYETVMNIGEKDASRSHRSRKKRAKPHKITGIEPLNFDHSKVVITSNDSRIRLYDIRSKEIERKYRGYSNPSSQIRASLSHDDRYIISGSEDSWIYIWRSELNRSNSLTVNFSRKKYRHSGRAYERIRVRNTMVTSAIFAPNPTALINHLHSSMNFSPLSARATPITSEDSIYVMVTADDKGQLNILVNRSM